MSDALRFLFVMAECGGNVPPQLGLAHALVRRGHAVFVLGDPAIAPEVAQAGGSFMPFQRAPHHHMRDRHADRVRDWEPANPVAQFRRIADEVFFGPAEAYARDVLDAIARVRPDAIAIDYLVAGAIVGAERSGLPTALLVHTPFQLPAEGVTPYGLGLRPARGPLGALRDRLLLGFIDRQADRGLPRLNAARQAVGLPPLARASDQYWRADRILVMTARAFDFVPPRLPPQVQYIGPQLDDPGWAEPSAPPDASAQPLVLVSLGTTFQDQRAVTARVIEAVSALPVRALVTTGGQFAPEELPATENVRIVTSVPHRAVLPAASAVVCHGGHGTVIKALAHGVPLVCLPLGRDQADNAVRAEVAGAGLVVPRKASPARIAAAVRRVLEEPTFATSARRLAEAIRGEVEAGAGVAALEALAGDVR